MKEDGMKKTGGMVCVLVVVAIMLCVGQGNGQSGIYDRIGFIGEHGTHGSMPYERIDLFTGNVTLSFLDVYLPGPNDFDLRVWRIYNSKILKDRQSSQSASIQAYHQSWVGMGWTMHMGMVHSYSSNNPIIEFPDGRLETVYEDINDSQRYITREFLKYEKGYIPSYIPKLYFKNGVVWTFGATAVITRADGTSDPVRLVTKIQNAYGHQINIAYEANKTNITSITDSMGRIVTFVSSGTPRRLSQIKVRVNSTTYRVISYAVGAFPNGYTKLNSVTLPLLPPTSFEYEGGSSNQYELKKMNSPYGGSINYMYSNHVFYFNGIWLDSRVLTQKRIAFNSGEQEKVWDYTYPDYDGVPTGTVHIDGPEYDTDIIYNGYDSASPWKTGTIGTFRRGNGSLSETNEWTCQQVSNDTWYILNTNMGPARGLLPASFSRNHVGEASTKVEYLYERPGTSRFGQPTKVNYYLNGSATPKHYSSLYYYHEGHQSFVDRYLLEYLSAETEYSSSGTKLKEYINQYYEEDTKWGALKKVMRMKTNTESLTWDHTYISNNPPSLVTTTVNPPGPAEKLTFNVSYGVLAEETLPDYTKYSRTINAYDSSITNERINDGNTTTNFYYDILGSITRIDLPDPKNDITYNWRQNGENKIVVKQGENTSLENTITYFRDGQGRDLGHTETGDNTTLYYRRRLDAENRLVAENKGSIDPLHEYNYVYNEADDLVQISDPTGNVINISYSEKTKTETDSFYHATTYEYNHLPGLITGITDALGHLTSYIYDDIGRLTTVTINGSRTHTYEYDGLDNVLSESHPETGSISFSYDDSNRLSEKVWGGTTINYEYDEFNRLKSLTVGDGTSIDETIKYVYNSRFREYDRVFSLEKGWSRNRIIDDFGNVTSETTTIPGLAPKTISYSYDSNNNLSRITYPDGNWAEITSNQLNRPERLTFNSLNNVLVDSAFYGPGKAIAGLTIAGNGTQYSATHLSNGALDDVTLLKGATTLYNASYTYDNHGNVSSTSSSAPIPPMEASFGYDPLNRLTAATYSSGQISSYAYDYDEYGNVRIVRENGQPIFNKKYDISNRTIGNNYDARGNLLSEGENIYHWDKWNRLEYVTNASGELLGNYMYDERRLRLKAVPPLPEIEIKVESSVVLNGGEVIFECSVGGPPADRTFGVENQGFANLILNGYPIVSITGQNADQFSVSQQPTSPILPTGSTTFIVRFEPTSYGPKTATIAISNNDPDESSYGITLIGNPYPEINVPQAPDGGSWDFGTVVIPDFVEKAFTIQNLGEGDLVLSGNPPVVINGDPYGQFVVVQQPSTLIHPGGETTFLVDYVALRIGQSYAQLSIANNDPDENPYNITLMGYGERSGLGKADEADLDITSPDGGEKVLAGSVHTITWTGGNTSQYVKIDYSTDNGSSYNTIVERTLNTGNYDWLVPAELSPACLVRISNPEGMPAAPGTLTFGFNLKICRPLDKVDTSTQFRIRASLPEFDAQVSLVADLRIILDSQGSTESVKFNGTESELKNVGTYSSTWHNVQIKLNLDDLSGSFILDGLTISERIPLISVPIDTAIPEIAIFRDPTTSTEVWMDDYEVNFQDKTLAGELIFKPIVRDRFDLYVSGNFPNQGGWLIGGSEKDQSITMEPQTALATGQTDSQAILPLEALLAIIDESEYISPLKALKLRQTEQGSIPILKRIVLPETVPYDVSLSSFAITSGIVEDQTGDSMQGLEGEEGLLSDGDKTELNQGNTALAATDSKSSSYSEETALMTLSDPRVGRYYINSFDGRLLAEYDIFGNCLKEYVYFGDRLLAEYQPASGQYFYYTPDNIGSTRIVTNGSGNVVYSAAFNPYGGIQQTWLDDFNPTPKYSRKERDEETEMDYYGARYYEHFSYRWSSPDPVPAIYDFDPKSLNLYAFTGDNPINSFDVFGLWTYQDGRTHDATFCRLVEWLKRYYPELGSLFGVEGDPDDGIIVSFANLPDDTLMQEDPGIDPSSGKATFVLTIDPEYGYRGTNGDYMIAIAHEAVHYWNYRLYADCLRQWPGLLKYFNITNREDEESAYRVSVEVAGSLGRREYSLDGINNLMGRRPGSFNKWAFDAWASTRSSEYMARRLGNF